MRSNLLIMLLSILFSFLIAEFSIFLMYRYHVILIEPPSYNIKTVLDGTALPAHFCDNNPKFGTWHVPNSHFLHDRACFSVPYSFNSFGARDKERSLKSDSPRAVILGDSFVEGYGLEASARLSDLLETQSGREVLNFGISGNAGTVQYELIYQYLASKFDHDFVFVGVLPDNDFRDNNYKYGLKAYANRFRAYLVGQYPNYELVYFNKDYFDTGKVDHPWVMFARNFLREFTFSYRALGYYLQLRYQSRTAQSLINYSGYYDFGENDWDLMRFTLERICAQAREKNAKVLVFAIPREKDARHYLKRGKPPLSKRLQTLGETAGFVFVDLLPGFAEQCSKKEPGSNEYWLSCDPHWSEQGNRTALKLLKPYLRQIGFLPNRPYESSRPQIR